ncbi:MAG: hypothetical protein U5R48_08995 [Gammaproteobacteria bacterium]|nr:hypothetical protein [Gammaproteobacteria bacterium]
MLVDGASHTTYVAERHLAPARDRSQVSHPLLGELFATYDGEGYQSRPMH